MRLSYLLACSLVLAEPQAALSWGDEGHEVVALIAEHYLEQPLEGKVRCGEASTSLATTAITGNQMPAERGRWSRCDGGRLISFDRNRPKRWVPDVSSRRSGRGSRHGLSPEKGRRHRREIEATALQIVPGSINRDQLRRQPNARNCAPHFVDRAERVSGTMHEDRGNTQPGKMLCPQPVRLSRRM
ncbi:MAG: hypothetical protein JWL84_1378 [Rhodospirillales bacterium]|nr:hypothetical protein [Rhodospirillales bacterium]